MVFFHNLGVKLRGCLCGVPRYASAQPFLLTRGRPCPLALTGSAIGRNPIPLSCGIVLDLVEKCRFLNWKLTPVPNYKRTDLCMGTSSLSSKPIPVLSPSVGRWSVQFLHQRNRQAKQGRRPFSQHPVQPMSPHPFHPPKSYNYVVARNP